MPTKTVTPSVTEEEIIPDVPQMSAEDIKALLQRISQLEQASVAQQSVREQPKQVAPQEIAVVPAGSPKHVKYRISSYEPDDAMNGPFLIPGKKLIGSFVQGSEIAMDAHGNYRTGFELDKLELQTGYQGQELSDYQAEVKAAVQWLEKVLGQSMGCRNHEFWRTKSIKIESTNFVYDTETPEHLINYYNILAGSFPFIAKNRADAMLNNKLLYLDVAEQEAQSRMSHTLGRVKANALLNEIAGTWSKSDLLFLIYALPGKKKHGFSMGTKDYMILGELSEFIEGDDTKSDKKKRPLQFTDMVNRFTSPAQGEKARAEGLLKAAEFYGYIRVNKERNYTITDNDLVLGGNQSSAAEALISPSNRDSFAMLFAQIQQKWKN